MRFDITVCVIIRQVRKQTIYTKLNVYYIYPSQWPGGLRRVSATDRLLELWVQIPLGVWMSVSCELSGRAFCDGSIPHPQKSYRL